MVGIRSPQAPNTGDTASKAGRKRTLRPEHRFPFLRGLAPACMLTHTHIGCHIHSGHRLPGAWDKSGGKRKEKSGVPPHVLSFRSPYCIVLTRSRGSLLHLSLCTKRSLLGFRLCRVLLGEAQGTNRLNSSLVSSLMVPGIRFRPPPKPLSGT